MEKFRAYRVHDDGKFGSGRAETMTRAEFDAGNVMVRIAFASVNYKDALTEAGSGHKFGTIESATQSKPTIRRRR